MAHNLAADAPLEEVQEYFSHDLFATEAGCVITEAKPGHAVVEMVIEPRHRNALGGVMGGAIFTVADLASAVVANLGEEPSVSVSNQIDFLSGSRGTKLIATCHADKSGRSLGFYETIVTDDTGRMIARMTNICHR